MAPLAAAGYVLVGAALFVATVVGAVSGAVAWAAKVRLEWIGLLAVAGYLAAAGPVLSIRLGAAFELGVPCLVLALLTSWLIARELEIRARWRPIWAGLAAWACAMIVGFASVRLFGRDVPSFALVADVFLILLAVLATRRRAAE
jgi:hypothetical protein